MGLLSAILTPSPRSRETLVIIQSTIATPSWQPFVHAIINANLILNNGTIVCVCLLHPPETVLAGVNSELVKDKMKVVDWTEMVAGYEVAEKEEDADRKSLLREVCEAVDDTLEGPVLLVVDSPDTLCEDIGSPKSYSILKTWHTAISKRTTPSRMVLPLSTRSSLLPMLIPPAFSQTLAHIILHPPFLLRHLSSEYLILPPPYSPPAKFWPIFTGLAARGEAERLVWGADGTGWSDEVVVELLVRSASGKRTIERSLEGWRSEVCQLEDLEDLRHVWNRNGQKQSHITPDPTLDLPFNLSLTEAQQLSRAQVPLPYAHDGQPKVTPSTGDAAIYYDPDSADDIDEDDPDEDLDI